MDIPCFPAVFPVGRMSRLNYYKFIKLQNFPFKNRGYCLEYESKEYLRNFKEIQKNKYLCLCYTMTK